MMKLLPKRKQFLLHPPHTHLLHTEQNNLECLLAYAMANHTSEDWLKQEDDGLCSLQSAAAQDMQ